MTLAELQDLFSDAIQGDLEQGVAWLNDAASKEFAERCPRLLAAVSVLMNLETIQSS